MSALLEQSRIIGSNINNFTSPQGRIGAATALNQLLHLIDESSGRTSESVLEPPSLLLVNALWDYFQTMGPRPTLFHHYPP